MKMHFYIRIAKLEQATFSLKPMPFLYETRQKYQICAKCKNFQRDLKQSMIIISFSNNRCNTIIGTRLRKLNAFNFLLTTESLIYTNMKIYVSKCIFWLILVVLLHFSLPFLFFNLQSKKRKSFNLKISINFGRKLYLNELSYHTQIGRI